MRQKEHIDAMEIMGVNTASFLVQPKLLAAVVTIPMLVVLAAGLGIGSGFMVSTLTGNFTFGEFLKGLNIIDPAFEDWVYARRLHYADIYQGILKDLLFELDPGPMRRKPSTLPTSCWNRTSARKPRTWR